MSLPFVAIRRATEKRIMFDVMRLVCAPRTIYDGILFFNSMVSGEIPSFQGPCKNRNKKQPQKKRMNSGKKRMEINKYIWVSDYYFAEKQAKKKSRAITKCKTISEFLTFSMGMKKLFGFGGV